MTAAKHRSILFLALSLGLPAAFAADRIWSNTGTDWNTGGVGGNWSGATVPGTGDNAIFGAIALPVNPNLAAAGNVGALDFDNTLGDYQITQEGTRTLTIARGTVGTVANTAFRIVGGGIISVAPNTTFTGGGGTSSFVFNLLDGNDNSATLNLNGLSTFSNTGPRSLSADNGTLNFNGGVVANTSGNDGRTFLPIGNGTFLVHGYSRNDTDRRSQILTSSPSSATPFTGVLALAGNIDANMTGSNPLTAISHAGGTLELRNGMVLTAGQGITWTGNAGTVLRAGSGGVTIANTVSYNRIAVGVDVGLLGVIGGNHAITFSGTFNANANAGSFASGGDRQIVRISNTGLTSFNVFQFGDDSANARAIGIETIGAAVTAEITGELRKQNAANTGTFSKLGEGTLVLASGASATYSGTTTVEAGTYRVNGDASGTPNSYIVLADATLGGHGVIGGQISGAGLVAPGASPGILTAPSVNGAAGTDFAFEFTQTGDPTWATAAASGNDVLRLTAATPFANPLGAGNELRLYFADAGTYRGGFFTDTDADFSASVDNASFLYFIEWAGGSESYEGKTYNVLPASFVSRDIVQIASADFAGGDVNEGWTMEFAVAIPEPGSLLLVLLGLSVFGLARFRRR